MKHQRRTFENYLEVLPAKEDEGENADVVDMKLKYLINSVNFYAFDYVENCQSYIAVINVLKAIFIKTPSAVFARHVLVTT